ncbi:MAG: DMT family transporter [Paracoccaceae bacterium]
MTVPQSSLRGALLSLLAFAIYAFNDVIVKFLGSNAHYHPFQTIFFSGLMSFPLMTIIMMSDRSDGNLIPKMPYWTATRAVLTVLNGLAGFYAFSVLPLSEAYPIFFAMPMLVTLIAIPMLGEKVGLHRGLAVAIGLLGVLVVVRPGSGHLGLGHLAAFAAASLGAMNAVLVRKTGHVERASVILLYPMIANFVVAGLALPFVYKPMPITHLGLVAAMAALGITASLLSIAAYRRAPAIIVAPMQYSQIIWATIFGTLIFNESHDFWTAVGTAIIIASGIYIVLREDKPRVSRNRPVLETRSRFDIGLTPRLSQWLRIFDPRKPEKDTL